MKQTFTPGSRYVKDARVLHIKAVKTNGVLTSRGFMTYDEINTWSRQDKPDKPISPVSAKLTKAEKDEMYRHFPSAAAAIRFAIEFQSNVVKYAELRKYATAELKGSFIQTDEQRAHADRIFNELKGGSHE